jgi:hypothetical protein
MDLKVRNFSKKYIDYRVGSMYITSLREVIDYLHKGRTIKERAEAEDSIISRLIIQQKVFVNTSGDIKLMDPDKVIEVDLGADMIYLFDYSDNILTSAVVQSKIAKGPVYNISLHHIGDDVPTLACCWYHEDEIADFARGIKLPGEAGYIIIDNNMITIGDNKIELR